MQAGALRQRIIIQRRTIAATSSGASSPTWSTLRTVWAQVTPTGGGEFRDGDKVTAELQHEVTMRWTADVCQPKDRILWGSRILHIEAVMNMDERRKTARLRCVERP